MRLKRNIKITLKTSPDTSRSQRASRGCLKETGRSRTRGGSRSSTRGSYANRVETAEELRLEEVTQDTEAHLDRLAVKYLSSIAPDSRTMCLPRSGVLPPSRPVKCESAPRRHRKRRRQRDVSREVPRGLTGRLAALPPGTGWSRPRDKLVQLISQAIHDSPRGMLRVNHIYAALQIRYPFYALLDKRQSDSWKSSIRHALFQKWFIKLRPSTDTNGEDCRSRGSFWALNYGSSPHDWVMPTRAAGPRCTTDGDADVKPTPRTRDTAVGASPPESVVGSLSPARHRCLPAVMPVPPQRLPKSSSTTTTTSWPAQPTPSASALGMESELNWVPWPFELQRAPDVSSEPRASQVQSTGPPSQPAADVEPADLQSELSDYSHSTDPDAELWSSAGSVAEAISLLGLDSEMDQDHLSFYPWLHSSPQGTGAQTLEPITWYPPELTSCATSSLTTSDQDSQNPESPTTSASSLWPGVDPLFSTDQMTGLDLLAEDPLAPTPLLCSAHMSDSGVEDAEGPIDQQGFSLTPVTTLIGSGVEELHSSDVALLWGFVTSLQCQQRQDRHPADQWTTHGSVAASLSAMAALAYPNYAWQ